MNQIRSQGQLKKEVAEVEVGIDANIQSEKRLEITYSVGNHLHNDKQDIANLIHNSRLLHDTLKLFANLTVFSFQTMKKSVMNNLKLSSHPFAHL